MVLMTSSTSYARTATSLPSSDVRGGRATIAELSGGQRIIVNQTVWWWVSSDDHAVCASISHRPAWHCHLGPKPGNDA
jgi:hypothetical protein